MIGQALSLGASAGLYCMSKCAPSLASLLLIAPQKGIKSGICLLGMFLAGRLVAYCLLGALAGLAGSFGGALPHSMLFFALTDMALGVMLIAQAFYRRRCTGCTGGQMVLGTKKTLFIAGVLNSVTLCPPILLAFSVAVENGSPLRGLLFFLLFFLASSVYLLPFSLLSVKVQHRYMVSFSKIVCAGVGLYFVYRGFSFIFSDPYITY